MSLANFSCTLVVLVLLQICSHAHALPTEQQVLQDEHQSILNVRAALKKAEIIPTVIDDFIPSLALNVTWPSGSTADLGNTVKPDHMQDIPSVSLHDDPTSSVGKLSNMTYTIALTDPDAPSRANPKWSEMCHWIATNIPLSSSSTDPPGLGGASNAGDPGDVQAATQAAAKGPKEIMPYKPPGPPPRTGKHRYVFLAFAAANGTSEPLNPSKPDDRQHWGTGKKGQGVRQWARSNGLVPVAANFVYSQNDKQ